MNATLRHTLALAVLLIGMLAQAQQDGQYTQYMYTPSVINPAYAGTRGGLSMTTQYRQQWAGLDGAPQTVNFTSNGPLKYERMALGLTFISDQIGPLSEQTLAGDFAYQIPLGQYTSLSFGIKGGLNLLNIDYSKLTVYDTTETLFRFDVDNRLSPVVGSGVYAYSDFWYAGLSVPNFLTTTHYDDTTVSNARERMTFNLMGGYVFYLNSLLKFKPTFLVRYTRGAPAIADVSANFLFNNRLTLGASYRVTDAVSGLVGIQVTKSLLLGYSYDAGTTQLGRYNQGSHEVFLRYDFAKKRDLKLLTPRFF